MCLFLEYKEEKDRLFHEKLQKKGENKKDFIPSLATKLTLQTICMSAELLLFAIQFILTHHFPN